MKTIEEKAKAYDEARERAKQVKLTGMKENVAAAEYIFPELAESEDEKVRKKLIGIFTNQSLCDVYNLKSEDVLAYLEKQKEQKPAEWSEEDWKLLDEVREHIIDFIGDKPDLTPNKIYEGFLDLIDRLKFAKPKPKQEWSEEDEKMLNGIIGRGCSQIPFTEPGLRGEQIDWLKNKLKYLRPQPHWKPSEEQMKALYETWYICSVDAKNRDILESLYEQLKKLM